jgi:hypothetical protein
MRTCLESLFTFLINSFWLIKKIGCTVRVKTGVKNQDYGIGFFRG